MAPVPLPKTILNFHPFATCNNKFARGAPYFARSRSLADLYENMSVTVRSGAPCWYLKCREPLTKYQNIQQLHTTHGDLKVEIFCESVPKTAEVCPYSTKICLSSE
jgi:hypothetical protein